MTPNPRAKKRKQDEWKDCLQELNKQIRIYKRLYRDPESSLRTHYYGIYCGSVASRRIFKKHMPKRKVRKSKL